MQEAKSPKLHGKSKCAIKSLILKIFQKFLFVVNFHCLYYNIYENY